MKYSEQDIEDWLWKNPQAICGVRRWYGRQVVVPSGRIDLLGLSLGGLPVIVEVKRDAVTEKTLAQVCRYAADFWDAATLLGERFSILGASSIQQASIGKIAIGTDVANKETLRAAEGMGVAVLAVKPELSFSVQRFEWTEKELERRRRAVQNFAQNPAMVFALNLTARDNVHFLEQYAGDEGITSIDLMAHIDLLQFQSDLTESNNE